MDKPLYRRNRFIPLQYHPTIVEFRWNARDQTCKFVREPNSQEGVGASPYGGETALGYVVAMNHANDPILPRTVIHGRPNGAISDAAIEQRARENAVIAGRDPNAISDADLDAARQELEGRQVPDTTSEDAQSIGSITRDPSNPPAFNDGAKPNLSEANEQEELEHLVLDGVEEAQHDQMLAARQRRED